MGELATSPVIALARDATRRVRIGLVQLELVRKPTVTAAANCRLLISATLLVRRRRDACFLNLSGRFISLDTLEMRTN